MKRLNFLPALLCVLQVGFAQKPIFNLEDVSKELLRESSFAKDPGAEAAILNDYGSTKIEFDKENGFRLVFERQCRIKIYNDNGYAWATVSIPVYDDNELVQRLSQIKAFTYNLENGKVSKEKMDRSAVFKEKVNDSWTRIKFTLPGVKEGSIIEFTYVMFSNYFTTLPDWEFQKGIPVKHSELYVDIPEYFHYLQIPQGYWPFTNVETKDRVGTINTFTNTSSGYGSNNSSSYKITQYHWVATDVPAMRDEKFIGNPDDFKLKIEFQLASYNVPGVTYQEVLGSWETINKKFIVDYDLFGNNMMPKGFYKDELADILNRYSEPEQRMAAIYSFVTAHTKWNGERGYIPDQNIKKTFQDREGSCADINALLISMLRAAEIDADPVMISTRDHGLVNPVYPILDKYNFLIAVARINGKQYLMDATADNYPVGMLPPRCLNYQGRVISQTNPGWVELQPQRGIEVMSTSNFNITEEGDLCGSILNKYTGYGALDKIQKLSEDGEDSYKEKLLSSNESWKVQEFEIEEGTSASDPFVETINLEIGEKAQVMGNLIYLDPIISGKMEDNPFKQEQRKMPVDFSFPINQYHTSSFIIPEGYEAEALPKSISFSIPDKSAIFKYIVQQNGPIIQVVTHLQQTRSLYSASDYGDLREFYSVMLAKQNEQIVLKKQMGN